MMKQRYCGKMPRTVTLVTQKKKSVGLLIHSSFIIEMDLIFLLISDYFLRCVEFVVENKGNDYHFFVGIF